ncbi:MAG: sensor histidine kinase [Syntrophales bacterium]
MTIEFLTMVLNSAKPADLLRSAVGLFRDMSGCEAVGIRLRNADDSPYVATVGFPEGFSFRAHHPRDPGRADGSSLAGPCIPPDGCLCGRVMSGRIDPSLPFFTAGGSFWTNSTTDLLSAQPAADRLYGPLAGCTGEGYESVALFPLAHGAERLGLLQLNDRRPNMFSPDSITRWETLAAWLALALARLRAAEETERAEDLLERTFQAIPDLIAILDNQHRVLRVNRAMADRLGLAPDRCIGTVCHETIHGMSHPPGFCPHALTCRDGREHAAEVYEPVLGGNFLVTTTPLHDDQNLVVGSIHVARDITDRKRMEEELRQKSNRMEAANHELEAFAYSVSHDLRAPLRAIDGFSRMLARSAGEQLDEEGRRKLRTIRDNVRKMEQLIEDLLAFSRFGRAAMSPALLDMGKLADLVWEELRDLTPERRIELHRAELPAVYGDRTLVRQVFVNLLSNAIKFTKDRDIAVVEIGGCRQEGENHYFVKDNGTGFDMRYADKLFTVFQRLHSDAEFEGTGVGLAIVQRIIHRHGGRVWAEAEVDRGATFHFSLPAGKPAG